MPEPIQIDNSELNTDWIKTPENRASEAEIHRLLAEQYAAQQSIVVDAEPAPSRELPE